jgi:hypothetical protein
MGAVSVDSNEWIRSMCMKQIVLSLLGVITISLSSPAHAAVPADFDADGVSDVTRVTKQSDGSLVWSATLSSTGIVTTIGSLGRAGDTPLMAQWVGGKTQIGVVSPNVETTEGLQWSIISESGIRVDKSFGQKGDVVVAGGDFDGNGSADAAVVRLVDGQAVWEIALDLFAAPEAVVKEVTFGKRGDRVFFARIDDSGVDWLGVIGKGSKGRAQARFRNLVTGEIRRFARMPKIAVTGTRPRPFPIRQSSGPDLLGFQVVKGSGTTISVFSIEGARVSLSTFSDSGALAIGEYNSGPGFEFVFLQGGASAVVVNPVLGEEREVALGVLEDGEEVVDEVSLSVVGTNPSSDGNGAGNGGSTGGVAQCSSMVGWPSGHIYKTIGSEHFFDVRRNTIGVVVRPGGRGPFPSCVDAIDTSGNVLARLGLYERGNGWEARFYAGIGCGSSTAFNGATVASKARANTGSSQIYMNFGGVCYGPIDAGSCIGSSQC